VRLQPGSRWARDIETAIEECDAFVAVMTEHSRSSDWVQREINLAQELDKPIVPLLVDGRCFLSLRDYQYEKVDYQTMPSRHFATQLARAKTAEGEKRTTETDHHLGLVATSDEPRINVAAHQIRAGTMAGPPSVQIGAAGIIQRGADVLHSPGRWFDLPRESALAEETVERLGSALVHVQRLHRFRKGIGLAAPQLGLSLAAAVVRPIGAREPIVLLNPRVVAASAETDEQFEGCLSFFDVRGLVARPLRLTVESATIAGERIRVTYEQAVARLVAHEIDHLNGQLYTDRMSADAPLVPVTQYDQADQPWVY
jgi:peptide deformylase